MRRLALLAACFLVGLAVGPVTTAGPAMADSAAGWVATPGVVPPQAQINGATYGEWSAAWWQWALETPVHTGNAITHPLLATGDVNCAIPQTGHVWFLGGNFNGVPGSVLTRNCAIPTNTFLFTPIWNAWQDNSNCDGTPPTTFTTAQLRAFVADSVNSATAMLVTIDGRNVSDLDSPTSPYRATSPVFSYTTPADSLINHVFCPFHAQTVTGAVADGVYVMLTPLAPGLHTVQWSVKSGDTVILNVIYHLTVG